MPKRDSAPIGAPTWNDLFTSDPDQAVAFYTALFGWKVEDPGPEYGGYKNFTKDDIPVAGFMANDGQWGEPDSWSIYLSTDDAQRTMDAAVKHGGQVRFGPMEVMALGTQGMVTDPGGATIGVWQPNQVQGFGLLAEPDAPAWFELHTRGYDAAVKFYTDVFMWDAHTAVDTPELRYTTYGEADGALAGIMDATGFLPDGVPSHWSVYFQTEDADATQAKVEQLGGSVVMPAMDTPYGRLATVADTTGAVFKLQQP
jgi:predicted enzyme related to lactoylglutathione lyase